MSWPKTASRLPSGRPDGEGVDDSVTRSRTLSKPVPQARPAVRPSAQPSPPVGRPSPPRVEVATSSPEGLTIAPVAGPGNDPSIEFDWEPVTIGSNRSLACIATSPAAHDVVVTMEQGSYQRSLQGSGAVRLPDIPVAAAGTQGRLVARDVVTGATAAFTWQWQRGAGGAAAHAPARKPGLLARLFARKPQSAAARPKSQVETDGARARRLGARAPRAVPLHFYAQAALGQRFAFILDMSGSMQGARWGSCKRELIKVLHAMPDHVEFFVVLFGSRTLEPPGQGGWVRAEKPRVERVITWLDSIFPSGGTFPAPAFERVFSLPDVPDVIYFLTDGEVEGLTPENCAALRGSYPTIINTIALETQASSATLEAIASQSSGTYARVASAG